MAYIKKTSSFFKIMYTLFAGLLLIAWVFMFGTASDDGYTLNGPTKALADSPSCSSCTSSGGCGGADNGSCASCSDADGSCDGNPNCGPGTCGPF